jgi:aminoglycoside 3-N-acetyltransferase
LARIGGKRVVRTEVPFADARQTVWRMVEEFDTSRAVVNSLPDDYFSMIVTEFLARGGGAAGRIGMASSVLVLSSDILMFAVEWLERRFAGSD